MSKRSRNWCFTLNNWNLIEEKFIQDIPCKYMQYGHEQGAVCNTPHLQGFVVFENPRRFDTVKELFPDRTHLEVMKGRIEDNERYVSKEKLAFTKGAAPKTQAEKGDANAQRFKDAFAAAKEGKLDDIPEDIRVRYYNTWNNIKKDYAPPPSDLDVLEHYWYYGPSGSGKSSSARRDYPGAYDKLINKWWDGYKGESAVIIDDLDPSHADSQRHHLKRWSDHYAFPAETKGSKLSIRPKHIIVTSQYSIDQVFPDVETREALHRRFKEIQFPRVEICHEGLPVLELGCTPVVKHMAFVHWKDMK